MVEKAIAGLFVVSALILLPFAAMADDYDSGVYGTSIDYGSYDNSGSYDSGVYGTS
ncbi:MAG: hypothetical protein JWO43_174, partial [Candidatus Adlerbacteria bacterium]|nr:hypothetical protein [Candidatus Adlerbacteria bacterium]